MERKTTNKIFISLVIPCLNEIKTIERAIEDAYKWGNKFFYNEFEIIIADNGSKDGTLELLRKNKKVRLINVPIRGYGAALHWGIVKSFGKYVIFADADLSYPFSNIGKFKNVLSKSPDLVLGSRLKGKIAKGSMPPIHRYLGTPVLTFLIRTLYKIPTTDCNSGMRMIKKSFYKTLNMRNSGMEWASELLLKTALKGGKYFEVPILFKKDKRGRPPYLSTWSDGWRHLKAILLLKPSSLYPLLVIFIALAAFFYKTSFGLTFLFLDLFVVLTLSLLTLDLLSSIIEKKVTFMSSFLKEFRLIPLTAFFSMFVGAMIIVIPDAYLGTKLFLVSILGILFMWIFLIETIKTHLSNSLSNI